MRQYQSPDGVAAAAFYDRLICVIFRVSIRKEQYNYSNQCNIIPYEADYIALTSTYVVMYL